MCPASRRADALNALTLVENIARLATQGLFGFVFAALAQIGKAQLTFFCNAVRCLPTVLFKAPSANEIAVSADFKSDTGYCALGSERSLVLSLPSGGKQGLGR